MDGVLLWETELISKPESDKAYRERVVIDDFAIRVLLLRFLAHTPQPLRMPGKLVQGPAKRICNVVLAGEEEANDGVLDVCSLGLVLQERGEKVVVVCDTFFVLCDSVVDDPVRKPN